MKNQVMLCTVKIQPWFKPSLALPNTPQVDYMP